MKSKGILRRAITSDLALELVYREPAVSDQRRTFVAESLVYQPDFGDPEVPESRIEFAQLLSM